MAISASLVKELREKTGAGMMNCKKALNETNGDLEMAIDFLRKKGLSDAKKKKDRTTKEGLIYCYVHHSGKVGVMIEVNCETDFVARTDKFISLVKDFAMHIAAAEPPFLAREDVPQEIIDKEKEISLGQMKDTNKPANILEKIVAGKIEKYYTQVCLLDQSFVKDNTLTITELLNRAISELGENISISRFTRYQLGEK